jgi:hypothetical protein
MSIIVLKWPSSRMGKEGIVKEVYAEIFSDSSDAEPNDSSQTSDSDGVQICSVCLCFDRYHSQKHYWTIF